MTTIQRIAKATLKDGTEITIRPIIPSDVALEREFIMGLSPESRRFRFLNTMAAPDDRLLNKLTAFDAAKDVAFMALVAERDGEREIGVARICAYDAHRAEFAVAVSDNWQRKGLGTKLAKAVIDAAQKRGLDTLYSIDAWENDSMRHFAESLGFKRAMNPEDATEVIHTLELRTTGAKGIGNQSGRPLT